MEKFNKPEGQTTSDNFLKSEIEKDFLRAQSQWNAVSDEECLIIVYGKENEE